MERLDPAFLRGFSAFSPGWERNGPVWLAERETESGFLGLVLFLGGQGGQAVFHAALDMGFHQLRVRIHGKIARIELLPEEFASFMEEDTRLKVYGELKKLGFTYVTLDILGYRTGSMNETISI